MSEVLNFIVERDTYESILYAVLGGLLILSTYHLALFFQNRDQSYLLYSSYTFFSFLAYMPVTESGFLFDLSRFLHFDDYSKHYFTIIFNCIYFLFFAQFLEIKKTNKRWYQIIVIPIYLFIGISTLSFLLLKLGISEYVFSTFRNAFIYLITAQTIISFYILSKIKNNFKYYIIVGGVILYLCSVIGQHAVRDLPFLNLTKKMGDFIYFVGLLLENIAFSFALGHRQRLNYRDKVDFNKNLISEMQKNAELSHKINSENEKRLSVENKQIKYLQEISDLKLSILQTQMNPHFIFNALNSIKYYILENDSENAVNYLTKFSKIIRTILISSTVKEFTLEEELQTLKVYVEIENLRFNKEIKFTISIDPQLKPAEIKIPPMILQPFIENAIVHGIALVDCKKIDLKVVDKPPHIEIHITDNGIGRKEAQKNRTRYQSSTKSLGTKIADGMLKNYFGPQSCKIDYHDLYENEMAMGTRVVLQIPSA